MQTGSAIAYELDVPRLNNNYIGRFGVSGCRKSVYFFKRSTTEYICSVCGATIVQGSPYFRYVWKEERSWNVCIECDKHKRGAMRRER
jgi:hypothetical protein